MLRMDDGPELTRLHAHRILHAEMPETARSSQDASETFPSPDTQTELHQCRAAWQTPTLQHRRTSRGLTWQHTRTDRWRHHIAVLHRIVIHISSPNTTERCGTKNIELFNFFASSIFHFTVWGNMFPRHMPALRHASWTGTVCCPEATYSNAPVQLVHGHLKGTAPMGVCLVSCERWEFVYFRPFLPRDAL